MPKDIIIPNKDEFEKKLQKFRNDGAKSIHIVSDFDQTLTKAFVDGKKQHSSFSQLREGKYLNPDYVKKAHELRDIYRPIEFSSTIPVEEKSKKMVEWWTKHLNLMIEHGMNKKVIEDIVSKDLIKVREGTLDFLNLIKKHNIPLLILSAGLGNMIQGFLKSKNVLYDNIYIIANFFLFDKKGLVFGYESEIVHTFSKNEVKIKNTKHFKFIKDRKNVLLLGDNLGDLNMSEGLEHENIIKIGFLNENIKESLSEYKKNFDVIILDDGPMDFVNDLLKNILEK